MSAGCTSFCASRLAVVATIVTSRGGRSAAMSTTPRGTVSTVR